MSALVLTFSACSLVLKIWHCLYTVCLLVIESVITPKEQKLRQESHGHTHIHGKAKTHKKNKINKMKQNENRRKY